MTPGNPRRRDHFSRTDGIIVLRKFTYLLGAAACGAMVVSCGGDDSPTPTPTPTGTGTPTPSPTPTGTPTPIAFGFDEDFAAATSAIYTYAYFTPSGGDAVFSDANRINGNAGIGYAVSPEQVDYGYADLEDPVQFAGTDLASETPTMRTYTKGEETLILELPFEHVLRARYVRSDPFVRETVNGTLRSHRASLYVSPVTTDDDIDSALSFTGQAAVVGGVPGETSSSAVSSPATSFTVSGSDPTVTGTIRVFETVDGTQTQRAELSFSAGLTDSGSFSGDITDDTYDFEGKFSGALAGPNREELVIVFSASKEDDRKYVGSYIGD